MLPASLLSPLRSCGIFPVPCFFYIKSDRKSLSKDTDLFSFNRLSMMARLPYGNEAIPRSRSDITRVRPVVAVNEHLKSGSYRRQHGRYACFPDTTRFSALSAMLLRQRELVCRADSAPTTAATGGCRPFMPVLSEHVRVSYLHCQRGRRHPGYRFDWRPVGQAAGLRLVLTACDAHHAGHPHLSGRKQAVAWQLHSRAGRETACRFGSRLTRTADRKGVRQLSNEC